MKKTITIGIPAYKAQNTIEECLSSINIQTMRNNIEVVIANDNPGVDDYSYLKNLFPKLDIVLTETEKNGGPGVMRQQIDVYYRYIGVVKLVDYGSTTYYKSGEVLTAAKKRENAKMEKRIAAVKEEMQSDEAVSA